MTEEGIYSTSLTCVSGHGELYCMKVEDFVKRFKPGSEQRQVLLEMASNKEKSTTHKLQQA
jgi:tRNA U34 5-carboxymethylaminomethyl modifying enzyme MnmG/GidA